MKKKVLLCCVIAILTQISNINAQSYDVGTLPGMSNISSFGEHISVGKSSCDYWFASDGTPRNVYNSSSRGPINYWQTLGADIIGGIFGGPGGYLGVSALDIYYQGVIK